MSLMNRFLAGFVCLTAAAVAQMARAPANLDFSQGELGRVPAGWMNPTPGFPAAITGECSRPGARCALVRSEPVANPAPFGNLMQALSAGQYKSKKVRFRASVHVESTTGGRAQLWMRVDRQGGQRGFFDNMGNRPITSSEWSVHEISGDVDEDATGVFFGMMLIGTGTAYIDAVSFEVIGESEIKLAPFLERSRPLAGRGLENLTAFAKLFGYIRHFHPSDAAFRADWNSLAIAGVAVAENASSAADLARKLEDYFHAVAPSVRVFPASQKPPRLDLGPTTKMVSWRHFGFGGGNMPSMYKSERVATEAPGGKPPEPFQADLGGGVKALIPTALPASDSVPAAPPKAVPVRYTADDRATRIAGVIIAWNILQHFYPYFDVVQTDWPKALSVALQSAAADPGEAAFLLTLRRLLAALKDGHGGVYDQGLVRLMPPVALDWVENRLVVTNVADGVAQPVERGDAVVSIDGKPVAKAFAEAEALISGATPQWIRNRAASEMCSRPPKQSLMLELEPLGGGPPRTVKFDARPGVALPAETRPEKIAELKPGILYVDLSRINDDDWKTALPKLEEAAGIVFDLRGYPRVGSGWLRHLSETPIDSAQWHIPVVTEPDHRNMKFDRRPGWNLQPAKPYLKAKKAILTDGRAISYAESTLGIIEHYKLAGIVGGTTAGTNGNVNPFTLPGGFNITWTGMKVLKHDGSQHHGVGIRPAIPVQRTRAGVAAGRDEVLERALELFN